MVILFLFTAIILSLLVIESTLVSYPFVFILLFLLFMRYQTIGTLIIVLVLGCMLDVLRVVTIGITPLFSFGLFFVLFLYNRSLNLGQFLLIFIACFFATLLYSYVAKYPINLVLHAFVFTSLFVVAYTIHRKKQTAHSPFGPFVK